MLAMICNVFLCSVTLLTLQRTKLRYRPRTARGQASGARRRADGSPLGPRPASRVRAWFTTAIPDQGHAQNHGLSPARVMSNQVAPSRERRPIAAKDVRCLGSRYFGRTVAPSQICLVFTLIVQRPPHRITVC